MNFVFTEEQLELQRVIRTFLADTSPTTETRRVMETDLGYDPGVWRLMGQQLGLQGITVPEALGGAGLGPVELALVFAEAGSALVCAPLLSTLGLAVEALLASGDTSACADLLPTIASGATVATLAVCEEAGGWTEASVTASATPTATEGEWRLRGVKAYVTDGMGAQLVLVAARSSAGVGLYAVQADADGLERVPMPAMDLTRPLVRLELTDTPARLVGSEGQGWAAVEHALDIGSVMLAAEQVGVAQRCLDMVVGYVKERRQFARPVGSFQAVKHACADTLVALEQARSAAHYAASVAADAATIGDPDSRCELRLASALARVAGARAATMAGANAVHFHGALGFTWEHDAHLFFKRARSSALLFGDPSRHRAALAGHLGL